ARLGARGLALGYDGGMPGLARVATALPLAAALLLACAAGAPAPEIPVLGSDATCADRAQARPVCLRAVEERCASQAGACEASCPSRILPGSSEKHPELSGDMREGPCRDGCREGARACMQSLLGRCPTLCGPGDPAPAPSTGDWHPSPRLW
ncbi:MAG TPA: hypothetical protein VHS09_08845, partial [Polyangiaceae bacterium]|nr:hypothetical protein [Polyangiaceae bacterium]